MLLRSSLRIQIPRTEEQIVLALSGCCVSQLLLAAPVALFAAVPGLESGDVITKWLHCCTRLHNTRRTWDSTGGAILVDVSTVDACGRKFGPGSSWRIELRRSSTLLYGLF